MKITIYNAISADGFISRKDDDTDWVSEQDWKIFSKIVKDSKAIVMGRKTYEVSGEDFPYDCKLNIVMTHNQGLIRENENVKGQLFTSMALEELVEELESQGYKSLLVIGGGKLNHAFMQANLVNELILDIHPIVLGEGVPLFGGEGLNHRLKLKAHKLHGDGLILATYEL